MKFIRLFITIFLSFVTFFSFAQTNEWTKNEEKFYSKMKSLCEHFRDKMYDSTQRIYVFDQFVYFDNILKDTSQTRIRKRLSWFDDLFYKMTHFVDSVGLDNLDAKPTRFFADNKSYFEPFSENGELNEILPLTLTYYDRRRPKEPIGTLLFEPTSGKLLAWLIINQGGYRYFLTFNLV